MFQDSKHLDGDDYIDDDKNTITLHSRGQSGAISSPLIRGMNLDLSFAADDKCDDSAGIQEKEVTVVFELPDGSQGENRFKLGQTIEVLKSFVESEYGIPMQEQKLYLDDKLLMNPLSLLDYPEAKDAAEMFVRVDGDLPRNSKK